MMPMRPRLMLVPLMLAIVPLGGCIRFGAEPPPSLLTLDSDATIAPGTTVTSANSRTISVAVPVVPQELAVTRVPVRTGETGVAYLKDAVWVEAPSRMFARLLSDTIAVRTGRMVVGQRLSLADPGARLGGELRQFGLDAGTNEAVVIYDATLIRDRAGTEGASAPLLEKRRFEARVPVASITPGPAGIALNQAANQVAGQVAEWIGR